METCNLILGIDFTRRLGDSREREREPKLPFRHRNPCVPAFLMLPLRSTTRSNLTQGKETFHNLSLHALRSPHGPNPYQRSIDAGMQEECQEEMDVYAWVVRAFEMACLPGNCGEGSVLSFKSCTCCFRSMLMPAPCIQRPLRPCSTKTASFQPSSSEMCGCPGHEDMGKSRRWFGLRRLLSRCSFPKVLGLDQRSRRPTACDRSSFGCSPVPGSSNTEFFFS